MTLRSFLPSIDPAEGAVSQFLKSRYDISSLEELIILMMQCLVFQRDIKTSELIRYYNITEPKISSTEWDYSPEYLKKIGKNFVKTLAVNGRANLDLIRSVNLEGRSG